MRHFFQKRFTLLVILTFFLIFFYNCTSKKQNSINNNYNHKYRPQFHYSPQKNWMNDPNGLVYFAGEYHLFYQYNPHGDTWGNMSWGHAVSKNLVDWEELPVAIPEENGIMAFSGSAVVDKNNTSGLGKNNEIPMVAIYTGYREKDGRQFQCLAYSLDRGRSWTKYEDNPVLDIGSNNFRDPHVFWYEPKQKWIMVIALSAKRQIGIYSSPDLKNWRHLSNFGPAGEVSGIWECPDLFPLPVEGFQDSVRWVMEVDLGANSIAGGSGGQYFIGDFNGEEFILDSVYSETEKIPTNRTVFADFESNNYGEWTIKGSAFGNRPDRGALAQQNPVNGYKGQRLVNSFYNGDHSTGVASSPEFTISKDFISFLIGGGKYPGKTCLNLQVNDSIIYSATGNNSEFLEWKNWNVENYGGKNARLNIIDNCQDNWGHINVDHIIFSDKPVQAAKYPPHWVDYGKDFYAAISYANIPESDGRRIWIGWMNNWLYTQEIPTSPWRSAQSLPRKLSLQSIDGRLRLIQQPVGELQKLRGKHYSFSNTSIKKVNNQLANRNIKGQCLEIRLTAHMTGKEKAGIKVRKGANQETIIGYNGRKKEVFLNRKNSGQSDFHDNFAEKHSAPLPLSKNILVLHIFVDRSSVEVFANNGQIVITDRIFPDFASDQIELFGDFGNGLPIQSLDIWKLKSIWQAKN